MWGDTFFLQDTLCDQDKLQALLHNNILETYQLNYTQKGLSEMVSCGQGLRQT